MTKANADETAFERAIETGATVKLACECDHESSYATFEDFNRARLNGHIEVLTDGEWDWAFANGRFRATCPKCGGRGETASLIRQPNDTIIIEMESSMPEPDREPAFSPAAPLSEKRATLTEVFEGDPPVEVQCGCGFSDKFLQFSTFEASAIDFVPGGEHLPYVIAGDDFVLTCPDCGGEGGEATVYKRDRGYLIGLQMSRAATCPSCASYIHESGFKEGPEAPEIGWEYYECPECGARTRPDAVGLEGA